MQIDIRTTGVDGYFLRNGFRTRLRACLLAPHWAHLIEAMRGRGYSRHVIYTTIHHALWFTEFAAARGIDDVGGLTHELVARYHDTRPQHPRMAAESRRCLWRVMVWLQEQGVFPAERVSPAPASSALLGEYLRFLADHRGIGVRRIDRHRVHVRAFLESLGPAATFPFAGLDAGAISRFVTARAAALGRSERKSMCAALRTFLRFLRLRGDLTQDLVTAVPVIPSFKLDRLPRGIAWEDVQKILTIIDRSTPMGRRDYALLLVLATYGIRSGQLCALRLDDLDWRHDTLRVRAAKGGRDTVLPLRPMVGEALVGYLRHGRPAWPCREVFLRIRAPIGPLRGNLTNIIKPYARKAGVTTPSFGPHAWRHACATRMLAHGHALKTIRDVLGHRTIETTLIYTKVDIEQLRHAALEWPEVMP